MKFIVKKIITLVITLFFISIVAFLAFQIIPGDPVLSLLGMNATEAQIEAMREQLGLNAPLVIRYGNWIAGLFKGDFGLSYHYQIPVADLLKDKFPVTLALAGITILFIIILAVPFGILNAKFMEKKFGRLLQIVNQIIMAIPSFFLGILITLLFGLILKWFTLGKYISYTESLSGFFAYLIAPAAAIAIPKAAMIVKFLQNSVFSQRQSDYVRTAFSKGNTENRVLYVHILKNACIPVVTILGMMIAEVMAGSIVVEQVFGLPGLGRLLVASIEVRDYPVVQVIIIYIAAVVVIVNGAVDILYRLLDPRIQAET